MLCCVVWRVGGVGRQGGSVVVRAHQWLATWEHRFDSVEENHCWSRFRQSFLGPQQPPRHMPARVLPTNQSTHRTSTCMTMHVNVSRACIIPARACITADTYQRLRTNSCLRSVVCLRSLSPSRSTLAVYTPRSQCTLPFVKELGEAPSVTTDATTRTSPVHQTRRAQSPRFSPSLQLQRSPSHSKKHHHIW
jgi:hypothetical protein